MRLFPATKILAVCGCAVIFSSHAALAQQQQTLPQAPTQQQLQAALASPDPQAAMQSLFQQSEAGTLGNAAFPFGGPSAEEMAEQQALEDAQLAADLEDPDSAAYKAHALANQAKKNGMLQNFVTGQEEKKGFMLDEPIPPELDDLQNVNEVHGASYELSDELVSEEVSLDIRRDAQKEAALSYGARGGLAKRNYQIMEKLSGYETVLDKVFDFRSLLVKTHSGLLIEPPIVRESLDAMVINEGGAEAAVAERIYNINKQAKIVSAPRDWRQYLVMTYPTEIAPPPRILWPKGKEEQAQWDEWVKQGWNAGYTQGEDIFESNLNRLTSEYNGMVRYRMLLAQGMISQPYALHEDRGVTGGKTEMRIGDRALRITGPSEFLTEADLWKPADR